MNYDKEFEEILASISKGKDKEKLNELLSASDNQDSVDNDVTFKALSRTERDAKPVITEELRLELESVQEPETESEPPEMPVSNEEFTIEEIAPDIDEAIVTVQREEPTEEEPSIEEEYSEVEPKKAKENKSIEKIKSFIKEKKEIKKASNKKVIDLGKLKKLKSELGEFIEKHKKTKEDNEEKDSEEKTVKGAAIKARITDLFKLASRKLLTRQALIIIGVVIAIIVIPLASVKIYNYSKVAYLKPYQEKYDIEYPEGILEQFCDQYGKKQSTVGAIAIEDTGTNKYVTNERTRGYAYTPKGTDIFTQQQFRAVEANDLFDIESIYSTEQGFINSSQTVTFNTLFEKKEYQVFGAYYTNKNAEDDNGYVFPYNIYGSMSEKSFDHFADSIKHRSLYDTGYEMTYDKNYLSVYANSDFMPNFVFVIICAEKDKDTERITKVNRKEKIHYPQVWYNANGINNPYIFSGHWYPEIITNPETQKSRKLTAEDYEF